jgi:N-acetylmuramoyl-L-alanine amidase
MLKVLKILSLTLLFTFSLAFTFRVEPPEVESLTKTSLTTVVLDAGHGGKDPGARGRVAKEKDIVLKIALKLGKKIKEELPDVKVLYTRSTDVFVELGERSAFANRNKADLFISIHCNATARSRVVKGTETFVMGLHKSDDNLEVAKRENSVILQETDYKQKYKGFNPDSPLAHIMLANYQSAFLTSSLMFADHVESAFSQNNKRDSRGVKQAGFLVLWRATMPSVLVEAGFLSNPQEEAYMNSDKGQEEIADDMLKALIKYKKNIES